MSTATRPLIAGERMTRAEFHERYEAMPPGTIFELIGGKVHMASPLGQAHGKSSVLVTTWVGLYSIATPGVEAFDNASAALDGDSEVQPDVALRIEPGRGGQTRNLGAIIGGAPELIVEVADSSRRIDLGPKLLDYERAGALEYVVLGIDPAEVFWFTRQAGRLVRIRPDGDGLYRSRSFPGLWLDPVALLGRDGPALLAALQRGLATPEHAAFVAHLGGRAAGKDDA